MGGVFQFCLYCNKYMVNKYRTFGKEENVKSAEMIEKKPIKVIDMLSPILYPSFIMADQWPFGKTYYRTRLMSLYETIKEDQILDNDKDKSNKVYMDSQNYLQVLHINKWNIKTLTISDQALWLAKSCIPPMTSNYENNLRKYLMNKITKDNLQTETDKELYILNPFTHLRYHNPTVAYSFIAGSILLPFMHTRLNLFQKIEKFSAKHFKRKTIQNMWSIIFVANLCSFAAKVNIR